MALIAIHNGFHRMEFIVEAVLPKHSMQWGWFEVSVEARKNSFSREILLEKELASDQYSNLNSIF